VQILLREDAGSAAVVKRASWKVLDNGYGTDLCGPPFRDLAGRLIGVDLSPRMLENTGEKKVYDDLHLQDIFSSLRSENGTLDLVMAADVFTYIGDLAEVFAACNAALRDGGHFTFSVESFEGEDFTQRQTGSFAHSSAYIEKLAQE
jgi:predicted TPR repeat methyltransferase